MATAFATIADVVRMTQVPPFDGSTTPTATQVQAFLDARAGQLITLCYRFGVSVDPNSPPATPAGLAVQLLEANAAGAALDATMAAVFGAQPAHTEKIQYLGALWRQYTGLWDGITPQQNLGNMAVGTIEIQLRGGLAFAERIDGKAVVPSFPVE